MEPELQFHLVTTSLERAGVVQYGMAYTQIMSM